MNDCVLRIIIYCYSIILDTLIAIQNLTTEVKTNNAKRFFLLKGTKNATKKKSKKYMY